MAVPGSIDNPLSAGPNMLLHTPSALAVSSPKEILEELGFEVDESAPTISPGA